jgi:hypothetical protein
MRIPAALLFVALAAAGCAAADDTPTGRYSMTGVPGNNATAAAGQSASLDPKRSITVRDCSKPIEPPGGNLRCQ